MPSRFGARSRAFRRALLAAWARASRHGSIGMGERRSGTHVPRARPTETESDTQGGSKRKHRDKATTIDGEGAHARDNPPGKRRRHQSAGRGEKCPQQLMQQEEGEQADPGLNVKGQRDNDDASDGPDAAEPANTPGEAGEASERATKLPRFSARGPRPKEGNPKEGTHFQDDLQPSHRKGEPQANREAETQAAPSTQGAGSDTHPQPTGTTGDHDTHAGDAIAPSFTAEDATSTPTSLKDALKRARPTACKQELRATEKRRQPQTAQPQHHQVTQLSSSKGDAARERKRSAIARAARKNCDSARRRGKTQQGTRRNAGAGKGTRRTQARGPGTVWPASPPHTPRDTH